MEKKESTGKIFAVGDIHGCRDRLVRLLERLPFDRHNDTMVFLGDYINRGPDTRGVIETLLDLETQGGSIVFLMGNHEHALLQYARTGNQDYLWLQRSMWVEATLESYGHAHIHTLSDLSFLPSAHRAFLERLATCHRLGNYLFIHAGVIPGEDVDTCSLDRLLTVREPFLETGPIQGTTVVFGHTPFETPLVAPGKIGIDTGASYGNMLTAVMLPDTVFFHG